MATQTLNAKGLAWKKRARTQVTGVARWKIWETVCGRYRVVLSTILYGGPEKHQRHAPIVRAEHEDHKFGPSPRWAVLSEHKKVAPALRACEAHARKELQHG